MIKIKNKKPRRIIGNTYSRVVLAGVLTDGKCIVTPSIITDKYLKTIFSLLV